MMPSLRTVVALSLAVASPFHVEAGSAVDLPDVESVLTKATGKMQDFAAQASAMQARVAQKQKASREALAQQKKQFEEKLESQAAENTGVEVANEGMRKEIASLEHSNAELKQETDQLQKENIEMHDVLSSVKEKVVAAKLFLADSLKLTDDSGADELQVLEPPVAKPTLEHFLEVAKSSDLALSLLQVKRTTPSEAPEDLVDVLSNSLADIATAEREGEAELKAHFLAAFESGTAQHEKLMSTQQSLNGTIVSLKSRQAELQKAKDHLVNTRSSLQQRLHGLRVFARKVDAAAYTALKTVEPASEKKAPAVEKKAALVEKKSAEEKPAEGKQKMSMLASKPVVQPPHPVVADQNKATAMKRATATEQLDKPDPDHVREQEKAKKHREAMLKMAEEAAQKKKKLEIQKAGAKRQQEINHKKMAEEKRRADAQKQMEKDKVKKEKASSKSMLIGVHKEKATVTAPVESTVSKPASVPVSAPAAPAQAVPAESAKHSWFKFPWQH